MLTWTATSIFSFTSITKRKQKRRSEKPWEEEEEQEGIAKQSRCSRSFRSSLTIHPRSI
jgi:hypothetical protein